MSPEDAPLNSNINRDGTARHIIALLSSHNQDDEEQCLSIALQVAANETRLDAAVERSPTSSAASSTLRAGAKHCGLASLVCSAEVTETCERADLRSLIGRGYDKRL
jgi:hypothetical protein